MIKYLNCIALAALLVVNYLAATIGINNYTTGELGRIYDTLFTPPGFIFSIWSVIYLLQILFCVAQFKAEKEYLAAVNWLFIAICALNVSWLFLWHYQMLAPTVIVMTGYLLTLIIIYVRITAVKISIKWLIWFLKVPFSIHLGWISVASIANIAVLVKSMGLVLFPETMTILCIFISFSLALLMIGIRNDLFYALVIIWSLSGIMVKYWQMDGYANLVVTCAVGLILIVVYSIVNPPKYFAVN